MAAKRLSKEHFSRWDVADYLKSDVDIVAYLQACLEEAPDDPALLAAALGDVARARGMAQLAKKTGRHARACTRRFRRMAIQVSEQYSKSSKLWD